MKDSKALSRPSIKWSADDKVAARLVSNEAQFYVNNDFSKIVGRLKLQDMRQIALSPSNLEQLKVAAFVPEKKGAPGSVKIYTFSGNSETNAYNLEAVATKSFFKAQECEMMWNPRGTSLLIKTHTDVDKSGKSYYGESNLFFLQADGRYDSSINLSTLFM